MKKTNILFIPMVCIGLASMSSCSCNDNRRTGEAYPVNPSSGQVYRDSRGNESVWNTALQCWMISSMMNGSRVEHHYYPSSGVYKDRDGREVARPAYIPQARSRFNSTTKSAPVSSPSNSVNNKATAPSTTKPAARSAGFGGTGRSVSTSAS